eukprot:Skav232047  [mRNA]  locus=scaffold6250:62122:62934:+ [translate_table: standard]
MLSTSTDPFDVAGALAEGDNVQWFSGSDPRLEMNWKLLSERLRWQKLLQSENTAESRKFQDLQKELGVELSNLSGDLAEAVEENRERFHLSNAQLAARKDRIAL